MFYADKLNGLIDFQRLQKLFETYRAVTDLSVWLYSADGEECFSVKANGCVCSFASENSTCSKKLVQSGAKSAELRAPYIFECSCGLVMCAVPIMLGGVYVGAIVTGPVILWGREDIFEDDFLQSCERLGVDVKNSGFDISSIKNVSCKMMTGLSDMLKIIVDYMLEKESCVIKERAEVSEGDEAPKNVIATHSEDAAHGYPVELERQLITCVRLGEREKARALINEFFTEAIFYSDGDLNVFKAKLYELMAFFSRAAVEAGVRMKELLEIVNKSSMLLKENSDFRGTCILATEILDDYIAVVTRMRGEKSPKTHVSALIDNINENYSNPELTLKSLASSIYLSSFYVSHLFKEELGETFVEYLTRIRIDKAKQLLKEGNSVKETAKLVGFCDVAYFNKVFKKHVGVTAAKYANK